MRFLSLRNLPEEALYIVLGVHFSCLYILALNAFKLPFLIGLILTTLIAALIFIRSNRNAVGYACALTLTLWLTGSKSIGWDTASFELPNFYDWINNLRGAYWDYSKLPSMFFGLSYTLGRDAYRLVYTLQAILWVIGLARVTKERRSAFYFAAITYLLLHLFPQLLDHGKGDLFALDFSLIALAFVPLKSGHTPEKQATHWAIFILFGSLAIASKLSAAIAILPLGLAALVRGHLIEVWRHNKALITLCLLLTSSNFSVNIYNLFHYGSVLDATNASLGSALSLIHQLPSLATAALSFPPNIYAAAISLSGLLALESILSEETKAELRLKNGVLLITLLMTPLVYLFEFRQNTNLRLIAFPVLAILAMNSWRICGNPRS